MSALDARTCLDKIAACFRYQHPEAFDRPMVDAPEVPASLRYGSDTYPEPTSALPEEPCGDPEARPIRVEDDTP